MGALAAERIGGVSREEALAFVDEQFGAPDEWFGLVAYRLSNDSQSLWKAEVGRWLKMAAAHGYLDRLVAPLLKRARKGTPSSDRDPNDQRHLHVLQALTEPMLDYYLTRTGWTFSRWNYQESVPPGIASEKQQYDSDLLLVVGEQEVSVQVKAPDRPGKVVGHSLLEGENDEHVLKAIHKARDQLPRHRPGVIGVSPVRNWSLAANPGFVKRDLVGSVTQLDEDGRKFVLERRGKFFSPEWSHVSAVMLLHLSVGGSCDGLEDTANYACTVLLNPRATWPLPATAFGNASTLWLNGDRFEWQGGEPGGEHSIPHGTTLVREEPSLKQSGSGCEAVDQVQSSTQQEET